MYPLRAWLKELEEKSGGRVTGEIAYGSVMGAPPEHYDLAATGVADMSLVGIPYTPGRFPMAEVVEQPIGSEALEETMAKAVWQLYEKGYFDQDFKDVKVLWLATTNPYHYEMRKGVTVKSFDDMKGKKMRASGATHTEIIKALGSVPVGMPAPEIYVSMDKGVIDGAFVTWSFIKSFRTETVTGSVWPIGVGGMMFAFVMNKATYDSFPPDIKAIVDEISPKYCALTGQEHEAFGEDSKKLLANAGGVVYEVTAADEAKIDEVMAPLWQKWIADGEAKGLPRKQMVDDFYSILQGLGVKKPFHGYAP